MNQATTSFAKFALSVFILAVLASCGGGGGGSSSTSVVSGVATAGAPLTDASISVLSSNGKYFSTATTTGSDGKFQITIDTSTYTPPYLLKITKSGGQSNGSYYTYVTSDSLTGLVVSPISNAALSLAIDGNLEEIFTGGSIPASMSASNINNAVDKIFAAMQNIFSGLGVTDKSLLIKNANYVANGSGQDAALDAISINSSSSTAGTVLLSSKLTGASVELATATTAQSIIPIQYSSGSVSLLNQINASINDVNSCLKTAINNNTTLPNCLDPQFLDAGISSADFIGDVRSEIGTINTIGLSSVRYCNFEDQTVSFASLPSQLANKSGICNANFAITAAEGSGVLNTFYKFTINSNGSQISSVKAWGNQLPIELEITPKIWAKIRVDGFTTNIGKTSGYEFNIGTALQKTNGDPIVISTSNLSAKVELQDVAGNNIDTFYMECQQGNSCKNTQLSICKNKSSTCSSGVDTVSDAVVSVNSTLSRSIINALQQGFVYAKITGYNKILSDNTKSINFTKLMPVIGIPIPQEVVDNLTFPALTSESSAAVAAWSGSDTLSITITQGSSKIMLSDIGFGADPSAAVSNSSKAISQGVLTYSFSGLKSKNGSTIIPLTPNCMSTAQSTGAINWRSAYLSGTFSNIPVNLKFFGSCFSDDY